jgi:hypothetical protein
MIHNLMPQAEAMAVHRTLTWLIPAMHAVYDLAKSSQS